MYSVYNNAIHGRILVETISRTICLDDIDGIFLKFKKEMDGHEIFLFRLEITYEYFMDRYQYFVDLATLETNTKKTNSSRILVTSNFTIRSGYYETFLTIENSIGELRKTDIEFKVK